MLKITTDLEKKNQIRVNLHGRFTSEYIVVVGNVLSKNRSEESAVTLDLSDVIFVDRPAMVFLSQVKSKTVKIENLPSYVMQWIALETQSSKAATKLG